ncbi:MULTISPECIES: hypothetical protein [Gordonia]|uniref:hypothetical protein n=1 Tax=Gordonia TaxID=2053 RepID=UPI002017929B|nr:MULTISPECIES: hypothetical protein [unclassified Gordonia (in: high G+C Gram-positive bacteria)]MDT0221109.1 hypothetical protein [Gordonia sp. AC31]
MHTPRHRDHGRAVILARTLVAGALCVGSAALSAVSASSASAEPTGCVAGSAIVVSASYCSGGTGEHRVEAGCIVPALYATTFEAYGPWRSPGQLSVVTTGAPTRAGECILPIQVFVGVR